MNILFALSGLHRYNRGAEQAFISIASELAKAGQDVTLIGSGSERPDSPYRFLRAASIRRERFERFPALPPFRDECVYEELTFVPGLLWQYKPSEYDVVLTCSYPFTNWILRRPAVRGGRPAQVFVTENGDWPALARSSESRLFRCDGLVCTNPQFYESNRTRWRSKLIPNGVDCVRFSPGPGERAQFGLPEKRTIVLMVSALIESKRVEVGVEAVSRVPDAHLVVAGDGPLRARIDAVAKERLPGRFTRITVSPAKMPSLYRSSNVYLHLSMAESSSLAFLEAMACGLPVVAHDSPSFRWITGDDEYLLDTTDVAAISRAIEAARDSGQDRIEARLNKVDAFSWINIAQRYHSFLQELTTNR